MGESKRFQVVHQESSFLGFDVSILLDTVAGVPYLYAGLGATAGLTPLLGQDGKPMMWDAECPEEDEP
jgi:hypothetical protein